jgi:hypothetical protein
MLSAHSLAIDAVVATIATVVAALAAVISTIYNIVPAPVLRRWVMTSVEYVKALLDVFASRGPSHDDADLRPSFHDCNFDPAFAGDELGSSYRYSDQESGYPRVPVPADPAFGGAYGPVSRYRDLHVKCKHSHGS